MENDIDTPRDLDPPTDGVPQWLVVQITKIKTGVNGNSKTLREVKSGQIELGKQLARTDQKIENHVQHHRDNPGSTNPSMKVTTNPGSTTIDSAPITYKWVADWGMKALFLLLGGGATVVFKLLYDFIADILAN